MSYQIGQTFTFSGKQYKVIGVDKRSFILESDGKEYKATADKIKKMIEQENRPVVKYPYLEHKVKRMRLFKLDAKIPTNEAECIPFFENLCGELSPENFTCDGELSRADQAKKSVAINATWKELESIAGRKFTQEEVESKMIKRILAQG